MKRISLRVLLVRVLPGVFVLFAAGYIGCNGETAIGVALGREFKIRYGQELTVKGQELTVNGQDLKVKFASLLEESRCPAGVECFWEGDARILIGVGHATVEEAHMELHTSRGGGDTEGRYQNYVIRLVALYPNRPRNIGNINQSGYIATLLVTKD